MLRNVSPVLKEDCRENGMDYTDYLKLPQSKGKVREMSQPVKILQLLRSSKKSQNSSKGTVKISQPERLTPYLKNASSQKKSGMHIHSQSRNDKRVRRPLTFTDANLDTTKNAIKAPKTSAKNLHDDLISNDKTLREHSKKSFLLPPNSIKDMHIIANQCTRNKSMLSLNSNKIPIITIDSGYTYSIKSEKYKPLSSMGSKSNKITVIQHTSSHLCNTADQPNISIPSSLKFDDETSVYSCKKNHLNSEPNASNVLPGAEKTQIEKRSINTKSSHKKECLSTTTKDCEENACELVEDVKATNEYDIISRYGDNKDEYVNFTKKDLKDLSFKLKQHICRMQEDISNMQLTLNLVENMLSPKTTSELTDASKTTNKEQIIENLNNDEQVVCNPKMEKVSQIKTTHDSPREVRKKPSSDASKCSETSVLEVKDDNLTIQPLEKTISVESEKENEKNLVTPLCSKINSGKRRRSARLLAKALKNSSMGNDSFENLEHMMNIENIKLDRTVMTPKNYTPIMNKSKNKMAERPWKEFVALKSRMSCLLTPNINRCNSLESSEQNVHPEKNIRASLSHKLIAELHNLYADSPDI